jgi:perosamine synthetase
VSHDPATQPRIPVFSPDIGEAEAEAVAAAVRDGEISGSFGERIPRFEQEFANFVGAKHGVAVTSGTAALQVAAAAAALEPGSEVLVSASTHVATALACFHNGLVTVPVDSEPETGNLDLDLLEDLITPATKAVIPVHLFGHPVDMDRLMEIAEAHDLVVIEDCAESHGATVRGRMTGSFGQMACFSFYANKIITTGEGGMVLTSDDELAARLRDLRNLGRQQPRFHHEQAGFNFRMTGYAAAFGLAQLAKIDTAIEARRNVARRYTELLADVPGIRTPIEKDWAKNVFWMYAIVLEDEFPLSRDKLMQALADANIETRTAFCPMNLQPVLQRQPGFRAQPCPVAEGLWERGMYLPSATKLSEEDMVRVVDAIRSTGRRPAETALPGSGGRAG